MPEAEHSAWPIQQPLAPLPASHCQTTHSLCAQHAASHFSADASAFAFFVSPLQLPPLMLYLNVSGAQGVGAGGGPGGAGAWCRPWRCFQAKSKETLSREAASAAGRPKKRSAKSMRSSAEALAFNRLRILLSRPRPAGSL